MALTVAKTSSGIEGVRRYWEGTVDFDSSYATGGESFNPSTSPTIGVSSLDRIDWVSIAPKSGYTFEYSFHASTPKILAYSGSSEVSNTTDLSAVTGVRVRIVWRG